MATKTIHVTAMPFDQFDHYWRGGHRWSRTPITATVIDNRNRIEAITAGKAKARPYELTPAQLEQLRADPRIRIGDGPAPSPEPSEPADEESERMERAAGDVTKANAAQK
jgi:hypothetical protein